MLAVFSKAVFALGMSLGLCAYTTMIRFFLRAASFLQEGSQKQESESEWEGVCSCLYVYCICVCLCVCTPLRSHLVWRSRRMYKVPFMLWSPLYLPRHQPGRYDVHNIFTFNSKLIFPICSILLHLYDFLFDLIYTFFPITAFHISLLHTQYTV